MSRRQKSLLGPTFQAGLCDAILAYGADLVGNLRNASGQ